MPSRNKKYNPRIHHRKSIRLKGYDYASAGLYFITICCENMVCRFGKIVNDGMQLNELGQIAFEEWAKLADRFQNFELDVFQIMPNHMHAIVFMTENMAGAGASPAPAPAALGEILGAYKSLVANRCLEIFKSKNERMGKLWQRNYYEHIIRSQESYKNIANYIINNPINWKGDKFYT